ncbi:MAG: alpha/beta hydrolase [Verrucomicrobiota bacterium]
MKSFFFFAGLFLIWATGGIAQDQDSDSFAGTWTGVVDYGTIEVPVVFELKGGPSAYTGEVKFPDSSKFGIPMSSIIVDGRKISLVINKVNSKYEGRITANRMRGEWTGENDGTVDLDLEREEGGFVYERPQNPREPFPYDVEEVEFANQLQGANHKLAGVLTKPRRPFQPVPAVILISDAGPHDRDATVAHHRPFAVLADHLTREGIAVLRFDDRGTGKSSGYFDAASTSDFATDLLVAMDFLKTQKDVDPTKIGLIGHGEGGVVASMVASQLKEVNFIVMLAGYGLPGDRMLLAQNEALGQAAGLPADIVKTSHQLSLELFKLLKDQDVDAQKLDELSKAFERRLGKLNKTNTRDEAGAGDFALRMGKRFENLDSIWLRSFVRLDPAESLKKVKCPVLALNGDRDLEVPADLHLGAIERAIKSGGNEKVMTRKLAGLNHLFQTGESGFPNRYSAIEETMSPTVLKGISQWIGGVTAN